MSYATQIKNEISKLYNTKSEMIAELSAFVRNNGNIVDNSIYLTTENEIILNRLVEFITALYDIHPKTDSKDNLNFSKNRLNVLVINEKVDFILQDLGYYDSNNKYLLTPPTYIVGANEEIRAYLRGVFLCQGSINDPKTSQYHMELLIDKPQEAVFIQKLLNIFDLNAKILNRYNGYMIYIKEAEKISDYLKILKANQAVLYFENVRIYHQEKNKANRLNNCEQANIDKIFLTASKQIKDIERLQELDMIDLLDDKLKEVIEYRLKYKESSLGELAGIISLETGTEITKSGLNHRFRKIKEILEKVDKKD